MSVQSRSQSSVENGEEKLKNTEPNSFTSSSNIFALRLLIVSVLVLAVMIIFNVSFGALGQGLAYSLIGVSVYLMFRVLDFPDLSVDGAFPIGGAVCAMMIVSGASAEVSLLAAFFAGALTGLVTALITVLLRIEGLLASIIVITGAYTITLRTLGMTNILSLYGERTILEPYQKTMRTWIVSIFGEDARRHSNNLLEIIVFGLIVIAVLMLLNWFMHTEIGLTIRATGKNSQMVRSIGINHNVMIVLALMLANGLAGLAGSLAVQQLGFADLSLGFGVIIKGLAAVMIGEVLLNPRTVGQHMVAAASGMVIFEVSRAWVFAALDLPTSDIRFVSALVVLLALAAPNFSQRWREWRKRSNRGIQNQEGI